jgi:hypothetical protein
LSEREWLAIEDEQNLKGKGFAQLGKEGHWLIDEASEEDRAKVLGLVPAVPRFVLLYGYGRAYRRERDACWRPPVALRVQQHGHNEIVVAAAPDAVWDVVIDLTRVGEWSHECLECTFLGDATRAEPGARFRGHNRQGIFRWGRVCEVLSTDDHELVWRTVSTRLYPDSTVWRIRVTPCSGGTRLEQRFDVVRVPRHLDAVYALLVPAHRDRAAALTEDLRRLGELASVAKLQATLAMHTAPAVPLSLAPAPDLPPPLAAAGWQLNLEDPSTLRWWNGSAWTDTTTPLPAQPWSSQDRDFGSS